MNVRIMYVSNLIGSYVLCSRGGSDSEATICII